MTLGKLYGVGLGPGAEDLITLRALSLIRRVPVLALPRSSDYGLSRAFEIVKPALAEGAPGQERLFLTFPMVLDPERLRPALARAIGEIGARLERGLDVAFACEGDPSVFSTFTYVRQGCKERLPGLAVEVVPGVTSITAVPAVAGLPLADGQERIAVLPGTTGFGDLDAVLRAFDTIVLMKIGPEMPEVVAALERAGLLDRAVYVSRATMREQRVERDLRKVEAERGDCFAMVVVAKQARSGLLLGRVPAAGGEP